MSSTAFPEFAALPDHTRLWIYGFAAPLSAAQAAVVGQTLTQFVAGWQTHGEPVSGAWALRYDQFALLATATGVSGCSIDTSVRLFKGLRRDHGLDALDLGQVFYRQGAAIARCDRSTFAARVRQGEVGPATLVFDLSLTALGDLRAGRWEVPFSASWHAQAFRAA